MTVTLKSQEQQPASNRYDSIGFMIWIFSFLVSSALAYLANIQHITTLLGQPVENICISIWCAGTALLCLFLYKSMGTMFKNVSSPLAIMVLKQHNTQTRTMLGMTAFFAILSILTLTGVIMPLFHTVFGN